ncbi:MAG: WD40 repeat domain-containing protein, partial [Spirochaetia bacterium]
FINTLDFHPSRPLLASGSEDSTLAVYNVAEMSLAYMTGEPGDAVEAPSGYPAGRQFITGTYDPSGEYILTGSADGFVGIWDADIGELIEEFQAHRGEIWYLRLTSDGTRVATAGTEGRIKIWDFADGSLLGEITGIEETLWSLDFDPSGEYLIAADAAGEVLVFSTRTMGLSRKLRGHRELIYAVAVSPDGRTAAGCGEDGIVHIWNIESGRRTFTLVPGRGPDRRYGGLFSITYAADGSLLAAGGADGGINFFNPITGQYLRSIEGHDSTVADVSVSQGNSNILASAGEDGTIRVWNLEDFSQIAVIDGDGEPVSRVEPAPDASRLVAGSGLGEITVWDFREEETVITLEGPGRYPGEGDFSLEKVQILSVAADPLRRYYAAGSSDNLIRLFDAETGEPYAALDGHTDYVRDVEFSPDGNFLASASDDTTVKIWDVNRGILTASLRGHTDYVRDVEFTDDGRTLISGSDDGTLRVWDLDTYTLRRIIEGHEGYVRSVEPSEDRIISGGDDGRLRVWDAESGREILNILSGGERSESHE